MLSTVIAGYFAAALIGISLGLIGGGGSILTVPILVYLFGVEATAATSYSLFIVGSTALLGSFRHYRLGNLDLRAAVLFAVPSIATSLVARYILLPLIPGIVFTAGTLTVTKGSFLLLLLAILMLLASRSMILGNAPAGSGSKPQVTRLLLVGLGVGVVTGLLGAGGGFLIIPALVFFAGVPMKQAVGTSLLIIFINSCFTFLGDLERGVALDWQLLITVSAIAFAGMLIGTQLSKRVSSERLKPAFGWFVLAMGIYVIIKELLIR